MQKIRLIQQLKSLNSKENSQLERYLRSPFFNNSQNILHLYEYLNGFYPEFDDESLTKESMFEHAFPEETYEAKKLSTLMWQFCAVIEDFFVALELKQSPDKRGILLKNSYRKRELQSDYKAELFKLNKYYNENETISLENNLGKLEVLSELLFQLKRTEYDALEEGMFPIHEFEDALQFIRVSGELNLDTLVKSLSKFGFDCNLKYKKQYASSENRLISQKIISSNVLLDINITANKLYYSKIKKADLKEYKRISDLYIKNVSKFSAPEQLKLYIILQNINGKFLKNRLTSSKIAFNVSKSALKYKVLGRNSSFSYTTFTQIAMIGSFVGEHDYTKAFIEKYYVLLDQSIKIDIKNYSLAYLAFFSKEYEEVDFLIGQMKFNGNVATKLNAKSLVIRSYYELLERDGREWISLLRSQLRSFDKYLNRTKSIPESLYVRYANFLAVTKKLTVRKVNLNKTELHQKELYKILSETSPILLDAWLKEKIDNLLKRKVG